MERDLSGGGTLENVPLGDNDENPSVKGHYPHTMMGGTAISNPMAPAFPHSNSLVNSQDNNSVGAHHSQMDVEVSYGSRPNSLPESHLKASHSYSGPNASMNSGIFINI